MTTMRALERHGRRTLIVMALLIVVMRITWLVSAFAQQQPFYDAQGRYLGQTIDPQWGVRR